jgi:energy-coupling factor transporter ATP-binding protein EcfA2
MPRSQENDLLNNGGQTDDKRLLENLKQAWGMDAQSPLIVVGQLVEMEIQNGNSLFLLERLEDPATGRPLRYPIANERDPKASSAFVPTKEAHRVIARAGYDKHVLWAFGELELSPEKERRKHKNPYECSVRQGSLRLLKELPEDWNIMGVGPQGARKISVAARDAIEAQIRNSLSRETKDYELRFASAQKNLAENQKALAENADALTVMHERQVEAQKVLSGVNQKTDYARTELVKLHEKFEQERLSMEERMKSLTDLMRCKGERLVSLELLDEQDLASLVPSHKGADREKGLRLDDVLDGDFSRLASFVQARLWHRGMMFSRPQLQDFLALLRTSDFVVLAGDSGSGKSSLVKSVAATIGARCSIVAVKPNWTGPEDLLGYFNPIERNYQVTPFLKALLAAEKEPDVLHFILLDEMNLARVEHYFADFLSLLESRDHDPEIPLFTSDEARHVIVENGLFLSVEGEARLRAGLPDDSTFEDILKDENANRFLHLLGGFQNAESVLLHHARLRRALAALVHVPTRLTFPPNVRIIGAINVDDTTYDLSPKVLDRAHVLRFGNPLLTDWDTLEGEIEHFDEGLLTTSLQLTPEDFGKRAEYPAFDPRSPQAAWLAELARKYLDPLGVEFGLRALRQSLGYLEAAGRAGIDETTALNNIVLHKVLPKISLDIERTSADGRSRREILLELRDALAKRITKEALAEGADNCVLRLATLIDLAEQNNGIANYWFR